MGLICTGRSTPADTKGFKGLVDCLLVVIIWHTKRRHAPDANGVSFTTSPGRVEGSIGAGHDDATLVSPLEHTNLKAPAITPI